MSLRMKFELVWAILRNRPVMANFSIVGPLKLYEKDNREGVVYNNRFRYVEWVCEVKER